MQPADTEPPSGSSARPDSARGWIDLADGLLEQAGSWMAEGERRTWAETSREAYLELAGRVNEDDECFERRMSAFLEYFLLDWPLPHRPETVPLEVYVETCGARHPDHELVALAALACSHHSVFELLGDRAGRAHLGDLLFGGQWAVTAEDRLLGVEPGDVFEARLFSVEGTVLLTAAICHHPHEARHLARRFVENGRRTGKDPMEIIGRLSQMRLSFDRYPRMPLSQLYIPG